MNPLKLFRKVFKIKPKSSSRANNSISFQFRFISKTLPLIITIVLLSNLATAIVYFNLSNEQFKGEDPFMMISEQVETNKTELPLLFSKLLPVFIGLTVFCLLIAIIYFTFITLKISRPLSNIKNAIQKIQFGDLQTEVDVYKKGEFSDLLGDVNGMTAFINVQILAIKENFEELKRLIKQHPEPINKEISIRLSCIEEALNYFEMIQPESAIIQ